MGELALQKERLRQWQKARGLDTSNPLWLVRKLEPVQPLPKQPVDQKEADPTPQPPKDDSRLTEYGLPSVTLFTDDERRENPEFDVYDELVKAQNAENKKRWARQAAEEAAKEKNEKTLVTSF